MWPPDTTENINPQILLKKKVIKMNVTNPTGKAPHGFKVSDGRAILLPPAFNTSKQNSTKDDMAPVKNIAGACEIEKGVLSIGCENRYPQPAQKKNQNI